MRLKDTYGERAQADDDERPVDDVDALGRGLKGLGLGRESADVVDDLSRGDLTEDG